MHLANKPSTTVEPTCFSFPLREGAFKTLNYTLVPNQLDFKKSNARWLSLHLWTSLKRQKLGLFVRLRDRGSARAMP